MRDLTARAFSVPLFSHQRLGNQLIANGPDIPDALLQAHEEGRVVFFCGAGIACDGLPAGVQGPGGHIYHLVGTTRNSIEQQAYERDQFDATLNLLELRLPGGRLDVRKALFAALQPKLRRKGATDTHVALLQLARGRDGTLRLVTTNFEPHLCAPCGSHETGLAGVSGTYAADTEKQPMGRSGVFARAAP